MMTAVFDRRFGATAPGTLGIEEELFVVSARSHELAPVPVHLLDGSRRKPELFRSLLELTTTPAARVADAVAELERLRAQTVAELEEHGLSIVASGTHPAAGAEADDVTDVPELRAFVEYAGPAARAQRCCGLHVHVSVEDEQACLAALEFVLPWLPLVLALSANSPYLAGAPSGYASARAELLTRLPRSGAPPVFDSFAKWDAFATTLVELGLADDYTRIWWDVRPHPRLGTIEVRMADQPTELELTGALAALVQALVCSARSGSPADRGVYAQNRFAAQRFGCHAELIHPGGNSLTTVPELTGDLLELVEPAARRLGSTELLAPLRTLSRRTQADEQLELGEGGLESLVAHLRDRTAGSRFAPAGGG
jgi:glutamate---cysteine ligase / carboxylate-amine ligase